MQTPVAKKPDDFLPNLLESGEVACEILNGSGNAPIILVCEHASNHIPSYFKGLGLSDEIQNSHVAWDPGAKDLAVTMGKALNAPLVVSNISRLVFDCNRPADAPSAMPAQSEVFEIPGNLNISQNEIQARVEQIYHPFLNMLGGLIRNKTAINNPPALITIHSFTPSYFGKLREVEIGILHADDSRLADAMLNLAPQFAALKIERNQPYGPQDGVTHTLELHGEKNGLLNVMVEVRNDLLADPVRAQHVANTLIELVRMALKNLNPTSTGNA